MASISQNTKIRTEHLPNVMRTFSVRAITALQHIDCPMSIIIIVIAILLLLKLGERAEHVALKMT